MLNLLNLFNHLFFIVWLFHKSNDDENGFGWQEDSYFFDAKLIYAIKDFFIEVSGFTIVFFEFGDEGFDESVTSIVTHDDILLQIGALGVVVIVFGDELLDGFNEFKFISDVLI